MTWTAKQIIQDRYVLLALKQDCPGHQMWLAFDRQSQVKVLIKILVFAGAIQWDEVQQFEREVAVLKRLHHPQMPSFVDAFNLDQPHFQKCLVQTYIHAPTLQSFLDRKQSIPSTQIWAIATQLLMILNDLHSLSPSILHRDLNPSNILIASDKTVFLINLGSVGIQATSSPDVGCPLSENETVGTYGYTPMEQFRGQGEPASDLYALGATLMALLSHTPPSELMTSTFRLVFPETIALAAPLRQWLNQLTEPDVTSRFSTAAQALQKLQQAQRLASQLENDRQDLSSAHHVSCITKIKTANGWAITVAPVWNHQTIATKDLVLLSALAILPLMLGLPWAIALSRHAQGFDLLGTDLLVLGLSIVPSLIVIPKLARNLLEQTIEVSPLNLTLQRKIWGISIQSTTLIPDQVRRFQLCQHGDRWEIRIDSPSESPQKLLVQLPALEIDALYRDLEHWRILGHN